MSLARTSLIVTTSLLLAACTIETNDGTGPSGDPGTDDPSDEAPKTCVRDRDILASETWSPSACPDGYLVKSDIAVRGPAIELKIEPGTVVKFNAEAGLAIDESAALIAVGTADKKIAFKGYQDAPATWRGLLILSNNIKNKIAFATVQHAGYGDSSERDGAIHLGGSDKQAAGIELTDVEISNNSRFGVTLQRDAKLTKFERVKLANNARGAAHVETPAVPQLKGTAITYEANGPDNVIMIETSILLRVNDAVWPDVSPAKYRVAGQHLVDGDTIYVDGHLTIEPGAVFEMAGSSGILVAGGSAGLKAAGTAAKPIVFKGVADSSWNGITFGETTWSENRLEHVQIKNAFQAPEWQYFGTGSGAQKSGVLMGYNFETPVQLTVRDVTIAGPNNAPFDITKKSACKLVVEGTNAGTGAGGALAIQTL